MLITTKEPEGWLSLDEHKCEGFIIIHDIITCRYVIKNNTRMEKVSPTVKSNLCYIIYIILYLHNLIQQKIFVLKRKSS